MASVFNRGTRDKPSWHGQFKDGSGKWRMIATGQRTKAAAQKWIDDKQSDAEAGKPDPRTAPTCGELIPLWLESITNRDASNDRFVVNKHLLPAFTTLRPAEIKHQHLVRWLDELKAAAKPLSGSSQRKLVNYASRFFAWCISRGHCEINPVRQLPRGERPRQAPKKHEAPWINDDKRVLAIAAALPSPLGLMFFIGNRCGMRPGEVSGLRLSDLADLESGCIRCRYSEDGPLKEDKGDTPEAKVKWCPAPPDVQQLLGSWLAQREAQKAEAEHFLFATKGGAFFNKMARSRAWRALAVELRGEMTWYEGTRHSFASRNLSSGVALEDVSAALGHSTPAVTLRHYSRFVRKSYGAITACPLQLDDAKVIPFPNARTATK